MIFCQWFGRSYWRSGTRTADFCRRQIFSTFHVRKHCSGWNFFPEFWPNERGHSPLSFHFLHKVLAQLEMCLKLENVRFFHLRSAAGRINRRGKLSSGWNILTFLVWLERWKPCATFDISPITVANRERSAAGHFLRSCLEKICRWVSSNDL